MAISMPGGERKLHPLWASGFLRIRENSIATKTTTQLPPRHNKEIIKVRPFLKQDRVREGNHVSFLLSFFGKERNNSYYTSGRICIGDLESSSRWGKINQGKLVQGGESVNSLQE